MTDNDNEGARLARYAEAMLGTGFIPTESDRRDAERRARAVLAVADSELAEVRAEVDEAHQALYDAGEWVIREKARAEAAEAERDALRSVVRDVEALHRRRPWDFAKDPAFFGQSEYPDQCDHCHRGWPCETAAALARSQAPQAPAEQEGATSEGPLQYATTHGYTPSTTKFGGVESCRVMLARYVCPYPKEEHDPSLPPVDVDAFGYRRPAPSVRPDADGGAK